MSRHAVDLALEAGRPESAAQHEAGVAVREALFGNLNEARRVAASPGPISSGRDAEYGAALALAFSGDIERSQRLATDLETRFPKDTVVRFSYSPTLRALIALNHRNPSEAIERLNTAAPYELGWQGCCSVGFIGSLYPVYVRGLAYLAAHKGAEAAVEFQKVLDHPGIVATDPMGAVARLQLGRAFSLAGDMARARAAYQGFLTLWRDADPDVPLVKQARAEYAKLG
jgi:eukaryotic-like serine/threonine-protein kinase